MLGIGRPPSGDCHAGLGHLGPMGGFRIGGFKHRHGVQSGRGVSRQVVNVFGPPRTPALGPILRGGVTKFFQAGPMRKFPMSAWDLTSVAAR